MPTLAENKHISLHFFLYKPRFFHFLTGNIRICSVRKGYQSEYSRADTKKNNINKLSKRFSIRGKY